MSEVLKPCPFCGGKPVPREHPWRADCLPMNSIPKLEELQQELEIGGGFRIACYGCGARTPEHGFTKDEAITIWNTRATDPVKEDLANLLKAANLVLQDYIDSGTSDIQHKHADMLYTAIDKAESAEKQQEGKV